MSGLSCAWSEVGGFLKPASASMKMRQRKDQQDKMERCQWEEETSLNAVLYVHILKYSNIQTHFAFSGKSDYASGSSCPTSLSAEVLQAPQCISHRAKL